MVGDACRLYLFNPSGKSDSHKIIKIYKCCCPNLSTSSLSHTLVLQWFAALHWGKEAQTIKIIKVSMNIACSTSSSFAFPALKLTRFKIVKSLQWMQWTRKQIRKWPVAVTLFKFFKCISLPGTMWTKAKITNGTHGKWLFTTCARVANRQKSRLRGNENGNLGCCATWSILSS